MNEMLHPMNSYPSLDGFGGGVASCPSSTVSCFKTVPFQSTNVTEYVFETGGLSGAVISSYYAYMTSPSCTFVKSALHPMNLYPSLTGSGGGVASLPSFTIYASNVSSFQSMNITTYDFAAGLSGLLGLSGLSGILGFKL